MKVVKPETLNFLRPSFWSIYFPPLCMHTSIQKKMLIKYLTFVTGPTNIWVITDLLKVSKERIIFQMTLVEKKVDLRVEGQ